MSVLSSSSLSESVSKLQNFVYCFQITLANGKELNLTSSDQTVQNEERVFLPNSGLAFKEAEFNDSAQNYIILEGIFETGGITTITNLNNASVKIILYIDETFEHFVTYYCEHYIKYDLNFMMHLKPEAVKYNQTIIDRYSKTCRADFGDNKCGVDKVSYTGVYQVTEIFGKAFKVKSLDKGNGYYNSGIAIFGNDNGDNNFSSKILSNFGNLITLQDTIPEHIKHTLEVKITPNCDKHFITCCNKYNNAINFRGEPLIPNKDFINANLG